MSTSARPLRDRRGRVYTPAVGPKLRPLLWIILVAVLWLHRPSRALVGPAVRMAPDLIRLVRSLLGDRSTPGSVKIALAGLLVYLVSPIDLIPDFIPVLGQLDDVVVAVIILRWSARRVGLDGLRAQWAGSDNGFDALRQLLGL